MPRVRSNLIVDGIEEHNKLIHTAMLSVWIDHRVGKVRPLPTTHTLASASVHRHADSLEICIRGLSYKTS